MIFLIVAAIIGIAVVVWANRRLQAERDAAVSDEPTLPIRPEDLKPCPACGAANLVKDETCLSCGEPFPV